MRHNTVLPKTSTKTGFMSDCKSDSRDWEADEHVSHMCLNSSLGICLGSGQVLFTCVLEPCNQDVCKVPAIL